MTKTRAEDRIAVFDSGVGGLSVLSELQKQLPSFSYDYCLDNAFYPYGTKSEEALIKRLTELIPSFLKHCSSRILVLACNTASTLVLEEIRRLIDIPVVGVVPAIKPAAQVSKSKVIGILATEATVRRQYTESLIQDFAKDCEIVKVGSRKLVELAEAKIRHHKISLSEIERELKPFFLKQDLDTVILACTHFDLLREEFEQLAPHPILWLSSASAVSARTKALVEQFALKPSSHPSNTLIVTKALDFDPDLLQQYGFQKHELL